MPLPAGQQCGRAAAVAAALAVAALALAPAGAIAGGAPAARAVAALPHPRHPAWRAPRDLMRRIRSSPHAVADPFHPGHLAPGPSAARTASSEFAPRASPLQFGGDPTGVKDSTAALQQTIQVCLNQSTLSPNGNFPGDTSFHNGHAIRDMGGCLVDLEGGEYLISAPLVIPEYNANMEFGHGSLVASKQFQGDSMIVIGVKGSCKVPQGSCNIDINFPSLFLDGSHVASGMQINNVMGVTIGPGGYFLNFTRYGIQINAGHEVMVDRCWLGETNFDYDFTKFGAVPNASAIQINGNDHYVLNTIVFSSRIGLEVHGAADYIQGVHVWFPINRALAFMGPPVSAKAFFVTGGGNRFEGCYADGGRCVFVGGGLAKNRWMNGFECCAGGGLGNINHGIILAGDSVGPGLEITHNMFNGGSVWHEPAPNTSFDRDIRAAHAAAHATTLDSQPLSARGGGPAPPPGSCASQFKFNASNVQCNNLQNDAGSKTAAACQQRCCQEQSQGSCTVWQWSPDPEQGGCWFDASASGIDCGPVHGGAPWQGGATFNPSSGGKATIVGVRVSDNSFGGKSGVGTRVGLSASGPGSNFTLDFCDHLVFQSIALVRSLTVSDGPGAPAGLTAHAEVSSGCTLQVVTSSPLSQSGAVFAEVDSSEYAGTFV